MTGLIFSYTDWQAKLVPEIETHFGGKVLHIGRRTKPLSSPSIRSLKGFAPFEPEGPLPILPNAEKFEDRFLSDYLDQMTRYSKGFANRAHQLERYYEYRDHFHLTARKVLAYLQRNDIVSILFFNIPHTGDDYLFYRVAEWIGIPLVLLVSSLFRQRFFSCSHLEDFGFLNTANSQTEAGIAERLDEELRQSVQVYMGGSYSSLAKRNTGGATIAAFAILTSRCPRLLFQPRKFQRALAEVKRIKISLGKYRRTKNEIVRGRKGAIFLNWMSGLERDIDALPEKIIYFAMHYQPEMTSSPQGGRYADQALLIEQLAQRLPDGFTLVAKENPLQAAKQRSPEFMERVALCEKVIVAHPEMDTKALIERSQLVATITGTVGWEAIKAGKPCLSFGYSWYRSCHGVTQYTEDIDLGSVLEIRPSKEETDRFLADLMSKTHDGVIYEAFLKDHSEAFARENKASLAKLFGRLMLQEIEPTFG
ncbi:MAG: hypothetical protein AAF340_09120 [Pseudomonadota bacterium]